MSNNYLKEPDAGIWQTMTDGPALWSSISGPPDILDDVVLVLDRTDKSATVHGTWKRVALRTMFKRVNDR